MTYVERLRERERLTPRVEYLSNDVYRRQKSALTRAVNSGDPEKVFRAVEKAVKEWSGKAWPDDWNRWRNALEDASQKARLDARDLEGDDYVRTRMLSDEMHAASLVLFP